MERHPGDPRGSHTGGDAAVKFNSYTLLVILGTCLMTQFEKGAPLWLMGRRKPGPKLERWLGFVPAAVLTALLVPELLFRKGAGGTPEVFFSVHNVFLLASVPAFIVAWWKRSFFGAVLAGMATVALFRLFL